MNKTAYLVVSVKDLRRLLKTAVASQKANNAKPTHCIVLRNMELLNTRPGDEDAFHLSMVTVEMARERVEAATSLTLRLKNS